MKYAGMPMGVWVLMKKLGLYNLTSALCRKASATNMCIWVWNLPERMILAHMASCMT